jgi:BR serine/threonine kinase
MKVKSGVFHMPEFSDPARDLISRLIVVDVSRRLTIPQMKQHECFRRDLPSDYIMPQPLPIAAFSDPIDPSTVSLDIIDLLRKIGYTNETELLDDFKCAHHSMAKVFYRMLTARDELDRLDWTQSITNNSAFPMNMDDPFMIAPGSGSFSMQGDLLQAGSGSLLNMSLASRPEWAVPESRPIIASSACEIVANMAIIPAVRAVQVIIRQLEMQWFHPDDFSIISRQQGQGVYILFQFLNSPDDSITRVFIRLCYGAVDSFGYVVAITEEALQASAHYLSGFA